VTSSWSFILQIKSLLNLPSFYCWQHIVCNIFLSSLTLCNTSFVTRSVHLIFSILLRHHISKHSDLLSEELQLQHHVNLCFRSSKALWWWLQQIPEMCWSAKTEQCLVVWNKVVSIRKLEGICITLNTEEKVVLCETVTEFEAPFRLYSWFEHLKYCIFYACNHICFHKCICGTLHWKSRVRVVHVCLKPGRSV